MAVSSETKKNRTIVLFSALVALLIVEIYQNITATALPHNSFYPTRKSSIACLAMRYWLPTRPAWSGPSSIRAWMSAGETCR